MRINDIFTLARIQAAQTGTPEHNLQAAHNITTVQQEYAAFQAAVLGLTNLIAMNADQEALEEQAAVVLKARRAL